MCGAYHRLSISSYDRYLDSMASERWKDDVAYAINPFKFITWTIGVWPLQVRNVFSLARYILGTCCLIIVSVIPTIEFLLGCTDADLNMDCIVVVTCASLGLVKITSFRIYEKNLADNYNSAIHDYKTIEDEDQRIIMKRHAYLGRILFCCMMTVNYMSCVMIALIPILAADKNENEYVNVTEEERVYTIPSKCTFEYFNPSDIVFKILSFIEAFAVIMTSNAFVGNDAMFLNVALHMCGQVEIVKVGFMNLDVTNTKVRYNFNALIERHIYLIQRTKQLIETVSFVLLTQFLMSTILLCIVGFQVLLFMQTNNIPMILKSAVILSTLTVQLALYSIVADYLKSQMDGVGHSIYQSVWYDIPIRTMGNIIFILMRTQRSIALRAGHFAEVNLSTYLDVLKTSASYLSVLRVMIDE